MSSVLHGLAVRSDAEVFEAQLREACQRDVREAATLAIEGYGPAVRGFLGVLLRDEQQADEAFALFCEDVWRGLPGFRWSTSARAWCYVLARHCALRSLRDRGRRQGAQVPLSQVSESALPRTREPSEVPHHLRTENRSRMRALRERLGVDEQVLLVLRIDKRLSWNEVALVMAGEGEQLAGPALTRSATTVRKRFQLAKEKLRELARAEGLL
ncbi:MAG: sigma-70 family RNA polymerase sigma factor [Myxococcaceae bacterium]|nr:sigma-70 family RNA polymerase sigma factor [Myxococcaceae bacterium]